jgi:hypothetical protein
MHPLLVVFIAYLMASLAFAGWILWSAGGLSGRRREGEGPRQSPTLGGRVARLAKIPVFVSATFTALCTGGIVLWQISSGLKTGEWEAYSVSDLFEAARIYFPRRYETASFSPSGSFRIDAQAVIEWLLDVPAIVPLLIATMLIALFYVWLARIAERHSAQ